MPIGNSFGEDMMIKNVVVPGTAHAFIESQAHARNRFSISSIWTWKIAGGSDGKQIDPNFPGFPSMSDGSIIFQHFGLADIFVPSIHNYVMGPNNATIKVLTKGENWLYTDDNGNIFSSADGSQYQIRNKHFMPGGIYSASMFDEAPHEGGTYDSNSNGLIILPKTLYQIVGAKSGKVVSLGPDDWTIGYPNGVLPPGIIYEAYGQFGEALAFHEFTQQFGTGLSFDSRILLGSKEAFYPQVIWWCPTIAQKFGAVTAFTGYNGPWGNGIEFLLAN